MTLEDFLSTSLKGEIYNLILIAHFVDKDGSGEDFTYKGCAIASDVLLDWLPADILGKQVIKFWKYDGFSFNDKGEIVKVDFKVAIEY